MDEQEIRELEEMFATNGWRRLMKDAEENIVQREKAALGAPTIEVLRFMQGEAAQLASLISLPAAVALIKAQANEHADL